MSMTTHVVAFRPPDDKWKKMKKAYDACLDAGLDVPEELFEFFNNQDPDPQGVEIDLERTPACKKWSEDSNEGFEVDLTKLPDGVKILRFFNSY